MTLYIQAHRKDGSQILGNLDGQTSLLGVRNYRRTRHYRNLKRGVLSDDGRKPSAEVHHWRVVDGARNDAILEYIFAALY